jgi:hypothetical protein
MEKNKIESGLKSGQLKLTQISAKNGDVWEEFGIPEENGYEFSQFAACKSCFCVFKIRNQDGRHLGTSNLRAHLQKCQKKKDATPKITHHFSSTTNRISFEEKNELKHILVKHVVTGMNSFLSVEQDSLKQLVQFGVKIGQRHPGCKISDDDWVSRRTVARDVTKHYEEMQATLHMHIKQPILNGEVALTTDLWTDNVRKRSYLDVSAIFLSSTESTQFCRVGLACRVFPDVSHTGENIKEEFETILSEFGMSHDVPVTSDSGANVLKALKESTNFVCFCHRFHTCFTGAIIATFEEDSEFRELLADMRLLQSFVSHSGSINHLLPVTIKRACVTRGWEDIMQLFEACVRSYDALKDILDDRGAMHKLPRNKDLLSLVHAWITPLREIFRQLEASKTPTIHFVLVAYYKLERYCHSVPADSPTCLRALARNLWALMEKKYWTSTTTMHLIAVYLHPNLKSLSMLTCSPSSSPLWIQNTRKDIQNGIIELASNLSSTAKPPESPEIKSGQLSPPPTKKARVDSFLDDMFDATPPKETKRRTMTIEDEMQEYISMTVSDKFENPLVFWQQLSSKLPKLSAIARQVYIIQASSAESERRFSLAGNIVTEKRGSLDPQTVEMLTLLKTNDWLTKCSKNLMV